MDEIKPDNVVYKATFIPPLICCNKFCIIVKSKFSINVTEFNIKMKPITVPTKPNFNKKSETNHPVSSIFVNLYSKNG